MRIAVVGNPGNRRVTLFADAARASGLPTPRVVPWINVMRGDCSFASDEIVRVESPGEDAEVARILHGRADPIDMYRVEGTAAWYRGFVEALGRLRKEIDAAGAICLADPDETAMVFDKARCHAFLEKNGIAVPPVVAAGDDYQTLKAALTEIPGTTGPTETTKTAEHRRGADVFVKIRHGSSASGVVALTVRGGRVRAVTSVELVRTADGGVELYNSLNVRSYHRETDVADIIDTLGRDGLHTEAWIPKATQDGRDCDLRIVTVAGLATHAVVRTSAHPMTNLHLGGQRGDLNAFRTAVGDTRWRGILDLAERTASCFPRTHVLGVDILPGARGTDYVGEVNAYGDLLPNLLGLPGTLGEGTDTYGAQIRSLTGLYR